MHVDAVIKHFETATRAAEELDLAGAATLSNWRKRYKGRVPEKYARRLEAMTEGELKFDPKAYGLDS